jgi:hypothetical protein
LQRPVGYELNGIAWGIGGATGLSYHNGAVRVGKHTERFDIPFQFGILRNFEVEKIKGRFRIALLDFASQFLNHILRAFLRKDERRNE